MSSHFSANQYETAFSSQRLQNYQVPSKHKERPSLRKGRTAIISNDRGHLNNVYRSTASPWGSFVGTWQMPRTPIQLKTRTRLMSHLASIDREGRASSPGGLEGGRTSQGGEEGQEIVSPEPRNQKPLTPPEGREQQLSSPKPSNVSPPPTSQDGSRPGTSAKSIQGSVPQRIPSSQGSGVQSPAGSSRVCSPIGSGPPSRAQSATVRSVTPKTPQSGLTGSRASSAQPLSRASRPESRMAESGTQSPLGSHPSSQMSADSHLLRSTTAGSVNLVPEDGP